MLVTFVSWRNNITYMPTITFMFKLDQKSVLKLYVYVCKLCEEIQRAH